MLYLVDSGPFEMFFDLDWSEDVNKEYPDLLKDVANVAALRAKRVLAKYGGDEAARKCMEQLVNKGYAYEIAVQAGIQIFVHNGNAKKMLQKLLKARQGAGIIQWTKENVTHSNPYIQAKAYQLIDLGVNERSSYPMDFAIEAVRKGLNSTELNCEIESFKLMQSLVSKGHEYKMALRAAQKGISDSDVEVRSAAYQFLAFLLDKDQVHELSQSAKIGKSRAMQQQLAVKKDLVNENLQAEKLLQAFVSKGKAFQNGYNSLPKCYF